MIEKLEKRLTRVPVSFMGGALEGYRAEECYNPAEFGDKINELIDVVNDLPRVLGLSNRDGPLYSPNAIGSSTLDVRSGISLAGELMHQRAVDEAELTTGEQSS